MSILEVVCLIDSSKPVKTMDNLAKGGDVKVSLRGNILKMMAMMLMMITDVYVRQEDDVKTVGSLMTTLNLAMCSKDKRYQ